jgi:hypothetical protein
LGKTVVLKAFKVLALVAVLGAWEGCATGPAVRPGGGRVYAVRVSSVNGLPTASRGSVAYPACTVQFGNQVAQVWIAHPSHVNAVSPVILQADEATLKAGVLVERSWNEAVVHEVTDAELASGTAVIYVPSVFRMTTVELSFEPVGGRQWSGTEDDLAERGAGLDEPVPGRNVSKR